MELHVARIFEKPTPEQGQRWLVDRLWPRGLSRGAAALDRWCQQIAPSNELRTWYGHDPERLDEFRDRYLVELADDQRATALTELISTLDGEAVTLLTATKDLALSHATVLRDHVLTRV